MDIYTQLGQQLKSLRGRTNQAEFAELMDLDQSHYAKIEKGVRRLQLHQLMMLMENLDMISIIDGDCIEILSRTKTSA